jgi:hypothetical protein
MSGFFMRLSQRREDQGHHGDVEEAGDGGEQHDGSRRLNSPTTKQDWRQRRLLR